MNSSTLPEPAATPAPPAAAPPQERDAGAPASTLIEFPRPGRSKPPQWRKELSERVREIQQRRALEASRDGDEYAPPPAELEQQGEETGSLEAGAPQLGLVPPPEPAEVNPIVAKALERIERARRHPAPQPPHGQQSHAAAAVAAARISEEIRPSAPQARDAASPAAADSRADETHARAASSSGEAAEQSAEPVRAPTLVVVPPQQPDTEAGAAIREALSRPRPRRHIPEVADDALLLRREAEIAPHVPEAAETRGERAPLARRAAAGLVDLAVVAFASTPFAAIIELTNGNWQDPRVAGSLAGIVLTIMFLYQTVAVAFSGRTWGMTLFSLRAADARTGLIPTTGQCARRALFYILSLAPLGAGLLIALFNSEGRAAHDHLSRTVVVVKE